MKQNLKIKKWWWENAAELTKSPKNIIKDFELSNKQIVVVSAIRSQDFNTTDELIELWILLSFSDIDVKTVNKQVSKIKDFHLGIASKHKNEFIQKIIEEKFVEFGEDILYYTKSNKSIVPSKENDYSIAWNMN